MNKETFETIKLNLETRINECKNHLDHILTTEDLKNITINEAQELKVWAKKESAIMTEIVMVDFYHIIGMGELTVLQTNTFIKLIKEYMSYRSDLKTIGAHFSLDNLPDLPSSSEFALKQLGDITLTSKIRGRGEAASIIIETGEVSEYTEAKHELSSLSRDSLIVKGSSKEYGPYKVEGNIITIPSTLLTDFINIVNPTYSRGKITSAASYQCDSGREYADIFWQYTNEEHNEIKAIVSTKNGYFTGIKNKLKKAFEKWLRNWTSYMMKKYLTA